MEEYSEYSLYNGNPLEFGYFLDSIYIKDSIFSFIGKVDCHSGIVSYPQPENDSIFDVWAGCYTSAICEEKALLCCVALNGYHSCSIYEWRSPEKLLVGQTPLLYCSKEGFYKCSVTTRNFKYSEKKLFHIFRKPDNQLCVSTSEFSELIEESHVSADKDEELSLICRSESPLTCQSDSPSDCVVLPSNITCNNQELVSGDDKPSVLLQPFEQKNECEIIKHSLKEPDKLILIDLTGCGSFGKVHKAVWKGLIVAAKVVPLIGNEKTLKNELNVYRSLQHPNVLSLLGVETLEGSTVLIMNLVDGQDLSTSALFGEKKIKYLYTEKLLISKQICQAMVFMHSCKPHPITHLDLKPANILVTYKGLHVYVADFGISSMKASTRRTTQFKAGTPGYQSPEQLTGGDIGPHCDVYAFGCVALELFSEKPIWEGLSSHAIMFRVGVKGEFPPA